MGQGKSAGKSGKSGKSSKVGQGKSAGKSGKSGKSSKMRQAKFWSISREIWEILTVPVGNLRGKSGKS